MASKRTAMKDINIIIISGISGSGKSTALKTLEDLGFFCVDNLPILLLPKFVELCTSSTHAIVRVGLVMDVREKTFLREYKPTVQALKDTGFRVEQIFLDCADETIIKRFSETRRHHPLGEGTSVREGLNCERAMLCEIKSSADRVLDTSTLNVHQLRKALEDIFTGLAKHTMAINFLSFGYKYSFFSGRLFQAAIRTNPPTKATIIQSKNAAPEPAEPIRAPDVKLVIAAPI